VIHLAALALLLPAVLAGNDAAAANPPDWTSLPLTDAATGETFTLGDYPGKTVYVEPMATWCTNCRRMLGNVTEARRQAGDGVAFVALSVEGNLPDTRLAAYAEKQGFELRFAVATPELVVALVGQFGRAITNPPLTPHFALRPDGSVTDLRTGIEPPEAVLAFVRSAVSEGGAP